ncbi:MAG TPA: hypothetical protein VI789_01445 [Dehalococcoidia bacterium]|nr:hypothetical protein [Dehalococcoidia bacterium]
MQQWEYLELIYLGSEGAWLDSGGVTGRVGRVRQTHSLADKLNELGGQGWELTGVLSVDEAYYRLIFKRPH